MQKLTPIQWVICAIAAIGFAFDIYEILMLPLIVRPGAARTDRRGTRLALSTRCGSVVSSTFRRSPEASSVCIGGYLTDRFGRRRVLTYSILIYAFGAFLSGFATSIQMLLVLRCFVFVGVCVEFVAAVAWLAELFTEPKQREKVLGYTQAFSSLGGLLVATINGLAVKHALSLPAIAAFGVVVQDPARAVALHANVRR